MKKYIALILMLSLLLCLCSCSNKTPNTPSNPNLQTQLSDTSMYIKDDITGSKMFLDDETVETLLEMWNNAVWNDDITKTYCEYRFIMSEAQVIYYSHEAKLFNDPVRNRHLFVTDEQYTYLNTVIEKLEQEALTENNS